MGGIMEETAERHDSQPSVEEPRLSLEEKRFVLEEKRFLLENAFAKKWLPTLVTVVVGLIAGMFGFLQWYIASKATERAKDAENKATERAQIEARTKDEQARIEAKAKDEREWGFKVVELYLTKRELFDLTKNSEQAASNLRVLAAVAPEAVQGVLNAERSRIPPPGEADDTNRLQSLAAVAGVQDAIANARPKSQIPTPKFTPADFTVYVQYPEAIKDTAEKIQGMLINQGYRVPGIQKVNNVPSRLEVRYYRSDQQTFAANLAAELGQAWGQALKLPANGASAKLITSSKELPGGILEVWLPRPSSNGGTPVAQH
jgi:hypothetical protein